MLNDIIENISIDQTKTKLRMKDEIGIPIYTHLILYREN